MNNLDKQYKELLSTILTHGVEKKDRTGTGTKSLFGYTIRHNMQDGFPLLTTKKMAFKTMVTELLWFLKGDTNIKYLVDNGCNIWNGDAYKAYVSYVNQEWKDGCINELFEDGLVIEASNDEKSIDYRKLTQEEFIEKIKTNNEFAKEWGELGPIYGKQWRRWTEYYTAKFNNGSPRVIERTLDQIEKLIKNLKTNPDSRRLMVSAWNVSDVDDMVLPPCHYGFQVYTREENGKRYISLMWNQRSVDTFLGLPFNIASYGLLLEMIAKEVNMIPDQLIGNLGDTHLYLNHIEQAEEQIDREPFELPKLIINDEFWNPDVSILDTQQIHHMQVDDFTLDGYQSHPAIKAPLSN